MEFRFNVQPATIFKVAIETKVIKQFMYTHGFVTETGETFIINT